MADPFRTHVVEGAPFAELLASVRFDDVAKGRRGAVLVKPDDDGVPIVRTTTVYTTPAQRFGTIHDRLAKEIRRVAELPCELDNALVEHYTNAYATMKHHSDQALDLAAGSSVAVFSCYRDPQRSSRRLLVKAKADGSTFEIPLAHNSVVVFDLETNRRFVHAIALTPGVAENDWLGFTFRTSHTRVPPTLTLATEEQRREFFQLRRRENDEIDFTYPSITYTLSPSDLLPPTDA